MSSAGVTTLSPVCTDTFLPSSIFGSLSNLCLDDSIFVYVSVSGSMAPMRVLASDTIESVKLKIQSSRGFVVKNQKLVCGGRELARRNSLLRDYGVTDGNVLHLVLRLSELQVIHVKTFGGREYTFNVERGRDVAYVKQQIAKKEKGLTDLEDQELMCNGERLEDHRLIDDICSHNDAVIQFFVRKSAKVRCRSFDRHFELSVSATDLNTGSKPTDRNLLLEPVIVNPKTEFDSITRNMVKATFDGLQCGNAPIRSVEGTGGAYFMLDATGKKYVSVFKPIDEEPMAVNNPRGLPLSEDGEGLKKGTRVGQGAFREVAAYILDHPLSGLRSLSGGEKGFSGVPPTTLVKCLNSGFNYSGNLSVKIGSLQMFMENNGSCEDIGPRAFPVKEVHKISVLDIRLANADRHGGNILLSKDKDNGQTVLIPIDHGYCLPESFEDCTFEWLYWPQAHQPYSPETVEYIKSLDAEEDIALLKFHGWELSLECARVFRISTMLLKKGVDRGFTPFTIGSIMCRESLNKESVVEEIVQEANESVLPGSSEASFLSAVSQIMDRRLDEIAGTV